MLQSFLAVILDLCLCGPQWLCKKFIINQNLCMPECDFLSLFTMDFCIDHTGEILAEIVDPFPVWRGKHLHRLKLTNYPYRCSVFRQDIHIRSRRNDIHCSE